MVNDKLAQLKEVNTNSNKRESPRVDHGSFTFNMNQKKPLAT